MASSLFLRRGASLSRRRNNDLLLRLIGSLSTTSPPSDLVPIEPADHAPPLPDLPAEEESSEIFQKLYSIIANEQDPGGGGGAPPPNFLLPSLSSSLSNLCPSPSPSLSYSLIRRLSLLCYPPPFPQTLSFLNWYLARSPSPPSELPFLAMIDFASKLQHFDTAWHLLDRLASLQPPVPAMAFHILIRRYVRAGLPDGAEAAFRRMPDYGLSPDSAGFSVLISALSKRRFASQAQALFDSLKEQFPPDVVLYTNVIHGWCRAGDLHRAEQVFREMKGHGIAPNVYTYTSVIEAMCRAGQIPRAHELLCQMIGDGCPPNSATFNSFLRAHVKAGRAEQALQVHNQMKQLKCEPDVITYNFLIQAHCRKGQQNLEAAVKMLNQMVAKGCKPNVGSFNAIFRCVRDLGNVNSARIIYEKMKDAECKPNTATYNILMGLFAGDKSSMGMVWRLKKEMEEEGVEANADTYGVLISALCARGNWKRSYELMKEMLVVKGIKPTTHASELVLGLLRKSGKLKNHEELVEKMAERGFTT